ncbi:TniB family NTP-binding protein, partial [Tepidanaerobacter sp. GT38]|uniref:TniB family NTP-binding protein n=1 Tax=Tepidanaerobacter sp. GT38 TaxID=2722793 RepID=UPI001F46B0D2
IDEIQHLSLARSGGSEKMLNFFVNLINNVGVPIVLVGTPKAIKVLQARRGSGIAGDMVYDRIQKDEIWDLLINSIWHYQWTRKETPLTPELSSVLYEETQGIPDLLKKVYAIAQAYAISSGKEEITQYIIKKVAKENLKLIQPMLNALKTNNLREIIKYDDIYMEDIDYTDYLTRTKESINLDLRAKEIRKKQKKMKQENLMERKKKVILKLVELGIDAKKAQKIIDTMFSQNVSIEDIIKNAMEMVRNDRIKEEVEEKIKKEKQNVVNHLDIRTIVAQAQKDSKNVYEAMKESGYIISYEDDIFSKEVVS